uniref:Solute carrier organic anion transporter family member n=1 Tax=Lepeophtheirus salmonis TaxID=72036 RepID=A0A0K2VBA2_LEPSM
MDSSEKEGVTNSAFVMDKSEDTKNSSTPKNEMISSYYSSKDDETNIGKGNIFISAKGLLMVLCFASLIQGIVVNGFVNVVISTLEKRFHLSSRETGIIASSYDFGSTLCVIPLSYLGGRFGSSKPRYIALGLAIMGMGSLIFSLPHFITGYYIEGTVDNSSNSTLASFNYHQICQFRHSENFSKPKCGSHESLGNYKYFFIFGQILQGIGASPLITLGNTLIDESVGPKLAPLYIGIFSTFFVIGPAVGFVAGGQLLNIYTDFYQLSYEEIAQIPSTLWVGSWWLGFTIMAVVSWICAALVSRYPSILPGSPPHDSKSFDEFSTIKKLPKALKTLFINPTYMLLCIGGGIDGFWLSGLTTFLPKYVESQYFISSAYAATIVGIVAVPSGGLGTFMGGWFTKKLKLNRSGVIKLYLICQVIGIPLGFSFLLICQNTPFAGVTTPYINDTKGSIVLSGLNAPCNYNCSCSKSNYDPICGADGNLYYNPCYAGCGLQSNDTFFNNCQCIPHQSTATKHIDSCKVDSTCSYLVPFILLMGVNIFITFMSSMSTIFATLRSVEPVHKSLALGLSTIILRLIGSIPGPMIFGYMIDRECTLWKSSNCEGESGNCLIYENSTMSASLMTLYFVFKCLNLLSYGLALFFSKRSQINEDGKLKE